MKARWIVILLLVILMAVGGMQVFAYAPPAAPNLPGRVDDALQHILAQGQSSDLVVEFAEQANLTQASGLSWAAKGDRVLQALQAVSQRTQAAARAYLNGLGVEHHTFLIGNQLYVRNANQQIAERLAALPGVARVRAPVTIYLDPVITEAPVIQATTAWGIIDTKADQFWSVFATQGAGIVVSNIDTGVQWDHPALVNQFKCPGDPSNPACWSDPSNICGGSACDNHGHGTHTMGTMVADDNPSLTYIAGMAPDAQWIACKGCESSSCSDSALNACADWILAPGGSSANRPHVVNNSWGGGGGNTWYLSKVNAWRAAGVFPAFSAGNSGSSCSTLGSPGDYQESFGSAAHSSSRTIASFSSRGPSAFGHEPYTKPNISAPGVSVCSTIPTNSWSCGYSGTSMASPHTAGAVALLWSCNSSLVGQIDQTFQILQDYADSAPAGNCGAPPDAEGNYTYGYGFLNVLAAGNAWCGGPPPPTPTPTTAPPTPTPTTPPGDVIFVDDFETNKGWTVNPYGTDTATTGMWERANPQGVDYNGWKQLDVTHSGSYDLVTGPLAGSSAGDYDIDNGVTSIRSPNIVLPSGEDLTFSFYYYLAHYSNSGSDDFLRVKVVGSTTQTVFQELGAADNDDAAWAYFSTSLNSFAGQTVYLLIEAADMGTASLVEAAVDDVLVTTGGAPPPPTPTPTTPPVPTPTPTSGGGW